MKLDVLLFGRVRSGPFFALLEKRAESMTILYCAIDQVVPGTKGGSVHVQAVAEGLAALGHEVHVLVQPGAGGFPPGAVRWHEMAPPLGSARLRLVARRAAWRRSRGRSGRTSSWSATSTSAAKACARRRACGALAVLEVNAPVVDYPGSPKRLLDRALLVEPMRRWRDWQCRAADLIVSPSRAILPGVAAGRARRRDRVGRRHRSLPPGSRRGRCRSNGSPATVIAVFAGRVPRVARRGPPGRRDQTAPRAGRGERLGGARRRRPGSAARPARGRRPRRRDVHGAGRPRRDARAARRRRHRRRAVRRLRARAAGARLLLVAAQGVRVHGVGPAGRGARRSTACAASSQDGREGVLYDPADPTALAAALERLADAELRRRLGSAARARAVGEFSWAGHCTRLAGRPWRGRWRGAAQTGRSDRHESADRHRLVSARLRRQRLEHVRAGARPPRSRARADDCPAPPGPAATASASIDGFVVREIGVFAPGDSVRAELPEERAPVRRPRQRAPPGGCRHEGRGRARSARDDDPAGGRRRADAPASRRSRRCATTGPSATGRI